MSYIFVPRATLAYGQDFLNELCQDRLDLKLIRDNGSGYSIPADCRILVAHDGQDLAISEAISSLPEKFPTFVHVHTQWSYLDPGHQNTGSRLDDDCSD